MSWKLIWSIQGSKQVKTRSFGEEKFWGPHAVPPTPLAAHSSKTSPKSFSAFRTLSARRTTHATRHAKAEVSAIFWSNASRPAICAARHDPVRPFYYPIFYFLGLWIRNTHIAPKSIPRHVKRNLVAQKYTFPFLLVFSLVFYCFWEFF